MSSSTPIDISQETPKSSSKHVPERTPGTTMLPLARIKRVIKEDKDVSLINAEATFCIAYATELFMEYLVTEAFSKARKEKRKTVYYKDLASTVKESDQLEFLEDVIPTTMTLKDAIAKRKENLIDDGAASSPAPAKKQKTKSTTKSDTNHANKNTTTTTKSTAEATTILDDEAENDEEEEEVEEDEPEKEDEVEVKDETVAVTAEDEVDQDDTMMEEDPKQD